jgi:hypothetical protein
MDFIRNKSSCFQVLAIALMLAMLAVPAEAFPSQTAGDSGQGVKVDLHHILISEANGVLEVREVINVVNGGNQPVTADKTLPEEEQYTFLVTLPSNATNLRFPDHIDAAKDIVSTATGFAYTVPLEPGMTELNFFYTVKPGNEGQFLLNRELVYPTQSLYYITRGGLGLSGPKMVYMGSMDMGEVYYWDDPIPGEDIVIAAGKNIKPDNSASGSTRSNLERGYRASFHSAGHIRFWNTSPFAKIEPHLFLAVFFGVLSSGTYFYLKGRQKEEEGAEHQSDEDKFQELLDRQKELLTKLAQAEQRHKAGELPQEEYQKLYRMYKEKLVKVKLQLKLLSEQ